jgi:NAD(P)-dependent dehydrogenase (short-subunit alcohol dehydrogenase family)
MASLTNKTALVTGASRGIGRASSLLDNVFRRRFQLDGATRNGSPVGQSD